MAITVGTPSNPGIQTGLASYSFSHTVENQPNRVLLVAIAVRDATAIADVAVTSVTYNGVAMSLVSEQIIGPNGGVCLGASLWILANPTVGANNVAVTIAGTPAQSRPVAVAVWGVDTTTPQDVAAVGVAANQANVALSITPTSANALVIAALGKVGAGANTLQSGQSSIVDAVTASASVYMHQKSVPSPAVTAMNVDFGATRYGYVLAALREMVFSMAGAGTVDVTGDGAASHTPYVLAGAGEVTLTGDSSAAHGVSLDGAGLIDATGDGLASMVDRFLAGAGAVSVTGYRSRATMGRSRRRDLRGYGRILPYISGGP